MHFAFRGLKTLIFKKAVFLNKSASGVGKIRCLCETAEVFFWKKLKLV